MLRSALASALVLTAASAANAAMIDTFVTGFQVAFDGATSGGVLTDFNKPDGGDLDEDDARPVSSILVEADGVNQFSQMGAGGFADLLVTDLGAELTSGTLVENAGGAGDPDAFGLDVFTDTGEALRIGIDDIGYTIVSIPSINLNVFSFFAEGKVLSQTLPNVTYDEDVVITFSASNTMVTPGATGIASLISTGSLTITGNGTVIPEPAAAVLLSVGSLALAARRRG